MPTLSSNLKLWGYTSSVSSRDDRQVPVRTVAPSSARPITVHTKNSEPFWESIPSQPTIDRCALAQLLSVERSVSVDVINGKEFCVHIFAANAKWWIAAVVDKCRALIFLLTLQLSGAALVRVSAVMAFCGFSNSLRVHSAISSPRLSSAFRTTGVDKVSAVAQKERLVNGVQAIVANLNLRHSLKPPSDLLVNVAPSPLTSKGCLICFAFTGHPVFARFIFPEMLKRFVVSAVPTPFSLQGTSGKIIFAWNHVVLRFRAMRFGVIECFAHLVAPSYVLPILAQGRVTPCLL